jgi:DnaJ like chaperone protein
MNMSEMFVSLFGLFLGYWVISKLFSTSTTSESESVGSRQGERIDTSAETNKEPGDIWYVVLGVDQNAAPDQVQAAYKSLISQYHPDKVASLGVDLKILAERKSKEINVAYQTAQKLQRGQF